MFYSLGIHWRLMESCKNVLENNSDFLVYPLFYFFKLLKISVQKQLLLSPHLLTPYGIPRGHVLIVISLAAKWDIIHQRKLYNTGHQEAKKMISQQYKSWYSDIFKSKGL